MCVDDGVRFFRKIAHRPEQRPRAARREPWRKAVPQSTVGGAMPARAKVRALLQCLFGGFAQRGRARGSVHETLARSRPNADRLDCFERSARVPHRFHVEDRRSAAEQELGGAQHRRPINRLFGMRRFEWPDALGEPCLEGKIVGEPAKEGLTKMDMGLDETGKDNQPRAIKDDRPFRSNFPTFQRSNGFDSALLYEDISFQNAPRRIHRDHSAAAKQQGHSGDPRTGGDRVSGGWQIEIRFNFVLQLVVVVHARENPLGSPRLQQDVAEWIVDTR